MIAAKIKKENFYSHSHGLKMCGVIRVSEITSGRFEWPPSDGRKLDINGPLHNGELAFKLSCDHKSS